MRYEEEFSRYLLTHYKSPETGKPLTRKAASDCLSRCRRVENLLNIELGKGSGISEALFQSIYERLSKHKELTAGSSANVRYPYLSYVHAVRKYKEFLDSM